MSVMVYELKAEYEFRAVIAWHVVPVGGSRSLCGSPLAPASTIRPISDLHHVHGVCRPCEALHSGARRRARQDALTGG
ncbi:hypothetical protein [Streptacidiphilus neutrinimicus]|uniref:hypothetical protein n=1 Tax=Streptacidiphilus neutrinimicus TaxID=105420 RepID=UPI0005A837C2|nr:hypothetical protein [Streptacidiphilus neutrinimicus]